MTNLRVIDPHKMKRSAVRRHMAGSLREIVRDPMLAGYALVAWNARGAMMTTYYVIGGPVPAALVPGTVKDVLVRHLAVDLAENTIFGPPADRGA